MGHEQIRNILFSACASMSGAILLPERLDISAVNALYETVTSSRGDIRLDASAVRHLGSLCLQVLLSAAKTARAENRSMAILSPSDTFLASLGHCGLSLDAVTEDAA